MNQFGLIAVITAIAISAFSGAAETKTVWLDELDVRLSSCGWNSTRKNKSVGGNALSLGGTTYERGIGTHGYGEFRVKLDKGTKRFTALVGIDGESGNGGRVEFKVVGDKNKVLWQSGIIRGGDAPKKVDVDLTGVDTVKLIVTMGGDGYGNDHADWVDAKFEVTGKRPQAVRASQSEFGPELTDSMGAEAIAWGKPEVLQKDWEEQYHEIARQNAGQYRFPPEQVLNTQAMKLESDKNPVDVGVRRIEALIEELKAMPNPPDLRGAEEKLAEIKEKEASVEVYQELRKTGREVILSNPLLDFDSILFVARGVLNDHKSGKSEYDGDHFCDQYYGHNGRTGGGLLILKNWKSENAEVIDVVEGLQVPSGSNEGMQMSEGTFVSPDLSWDGKTIVFGWSCGGTQKWQPENRFNIFKVNVDGTGLTRLTDGDFDDFDPCWLPGGRIVFLSTRRYGYGRCHGRPVPAYTMFSMKPDGSDLYSIDFHETNEFHPSVDNNGMLVYTRWDYVDRDHSAAHHMWHCFPDGRNPRSYHANYALPLSTVEEVGEGSINWRPWAEFNCRSIPGSDKYMATAGPHHGQAFGSLVMIDIGVPDDHKMSQVKRVTPNVRFPESECGTRSWSDMAFGTAWPLSESFYLCNYQGGAYVLDELGNRELMCRATNGLRLLDPTPLRARTKPPVILTETYQGERQKPGAPKATVSVMNVYLTDEFGKLPEDTEIKQMRVVQVIPKSTPPANNPRIGFGDQSLARIPLGVVPVEKDGSVFFEAPVGKAIYFQLLDETGMAVQSMRSVTYVHPGEQMTCVGCHEDKLGAPWVGSQPIAMRRRPSELKPEVQDHVMFSFHHNVRPIFETKCLPCHQEKDDRGPKNMDYGSLDQYLFYLGHGYRRHLHGGTRSEPGKFGAMFSRMGKALLNENHQKSLRDGDFTDEDVRSIIMWLDMNSNEFTAYKDIDAQRRGEIVWPEFDVDPNNISGVEGAETPVSAE